METLTARATLRRRCLPVKLRRVLVAPASAQSTVVEVLDRALDFPAPLRRVVETRITDPHAPLQAHQLAATTQLAFLLPLPCGA